jgi:hypothetical protein
MLAPGGLLTLEQPDFRKIVAGAKLEWIFGDPSLADPFHMNKWSYSPDSLTVLLAQSGFTCIDVLAARHHLPERDFRIEARK